MATSLADPVRTLEHSHDHLARLALDVGAQLRADGTEGADADAREHLVEALEALRDELLRHFAVEEEGLFPFLRLHVPERSGAVDQLAHGHDVICGTVVRLAHLASTSATPDARAALLALHARFEAAYVEHSRDEARLLDELDRTLGEGQRRDLAGVLRGL